MSDAFWQYLIGGIVTVILASIQVWAALKLRSIGRTADETHKIVNSQRTEMVAKIDDLKQLLAQSRAKEGK